MGRTTAATAQGLDSTGNVVGTIPVTYASTDTSIALVSTSGAITALYEGTVTIRATSGGTTGETTLRVLLDPTVAAAYWRRTPNAVWVEGVGMTGVQQLLLFDVSHDKLERLSVIDGAMTAPGDVHCRDVNGDGYDDLVADGIGDGVRPIVFLNNHAGRLVRVPDSVFPPNPSDGSGGWQSYFLDIDGDGIEDLLYFPRASCDGRAACANFPVYKGRRPLRIP